MAAPRLPFLWPMLFGPAGRPTSRVSPSQAKSLSRRNRSQKGCRQLTTTPRRAEEVTTQRYGKAFEHRSELEDKEALQILEEQKGKAPTERPTPEPAHDDIHHYEAMAVCVQEWHGLVSSHCGVEPLPVDFTEETNGRIYQSCLPQILEQLTNPPQFRDKPNGKETVRREGDYRTAEWSSTFIQSVTDQFDNQDVLNERMGFKHTIAESQISDKQSKHYPPKQPWVNYFGFPETETLEYLRDLFVDGMKRDMRVFASHLTSSPHHPFATPKDWAGKETYLKEQHWRPHDPFDDYLNTIKYQDDWISDIFEMLHDVGALQETLVVMTGDHGLAFNSVDKSTSAVNNGHISNFAVPLLFIHPDLPRVQVTASTTQMSIIPTILDLLVETNSLATDAAATARALLPLYQGNSLIRNLDFSVLVGDGSPAPAFFQPFHFSAINPGGSVLAIADASTTFRLILPLCSAIPLRFTDLFADPGEIEPIIAWTMDELIAIVKVRHGVRAKDWVILAEELGRWWVWNQRSKWGYWGVARSTGRGGTESSGNGQIKHKHWWETK